jgi:hypothetical protein
VTLDLRAERVHFPLVVSAGADHWVVNRIANLSAIDEGSANPKNGDYGKGTSDWARSEGLEPLAF